MKTEYQYGKQYAEWLSMNQPADATPVDIDEMCGQSVDIPEGDYAEMVGDGIENPDPRKYWAGFNSVFE